MVKSNPFLVLNASTFITKNFNLLFFSKSFFCSFLFFAVSIFINSLIVVAATPKIVKVVHKKDSVNVKNQQKKIMKRLQRVEKKIKKRSGSKYEQ